jgi:hypothetical protein
MKANRFTFPDDLGEELLNRSFDLTIKLTKSDNDVFASFKLEGMLTLDRPEVEAEDDTAEIPPDELDVKLLRRLLDRFQEKVEK